MMKGYGTTQVCEVRLTKAEIRRIVVENLVRRGADPSYDFDTRNPIVFEDEHGGLIVRFVQKKVTEDSTPRLCELKPWKDKEA